MSTSRVLNTNSIHRDSNSSPKDLTYTNPHHTKHRSRHNNNNGPPDSPDSPAKSLKAGTARELRRFLDLLEFSRGGILNAPSSQTAKSSTTKNFQTLAAKQVSDPKFNSATSTLLNKKSSASGQNSHRRSSTQWNLNISDNQATTQIDSIRSPRKASTFLDFTPKNAQGINSDVNTSITMTKSSVSKTSLKKNHSKESKTSQERAKVSEPSIVRVTPLKISEDTLKKLEEKRRFANGELNEANMQDLRSLCSMTAKSSSVQSRSERLSQTGIEYKPDSPSPGKTVETKPKATTTTPQKNLAAGITQNKSSFSGSKQATNGSKTPNKKSTENNKNNIKGKSDLRMSTEPDFSTANKELLDNSVPSSVKKTSTTTSEFYASLLHRKFNLMKSKTTESSEIKNTSDKTIKIDSPVDELPLNLKASGIEAKDPNALIKSGKSQSSGTKNKAKPSTTKKPAKETKAKSFAASLRMNEKFISPITKKNFVSKRRTSNEIDDFKELFAPINGLEDLPKNTDLSVDLENSIRLSKFTEITPKSTTPERSLPKDNTLLLEQSKGSKSKTSQSNKQLARSNKPPSLTSLDGELDAVQIKRHPHPKHCIVPRLQIKSKTDDVKSAGGAKSIETMNTFTDRSKFVEIRQENKVFMDLLQKMRNNDAQDPDEEQVADVEEEKLLKDIIEYINKKQSSTHNNEIDSYRQKINELEKKLQHAQDTLTSFNSLIILRDGEEDSPPDRNRLDGENHHRSKSLGRVQQIFTQGLLLKKSHFRGGSSARGDDYPDDFSLLESDDRSELVRIKLGLQKIITEESLMSQGTPILGALVSPDQLKLSNHENTVKSPGDQNRKSSINVKRTENDEENSSARKDKNDLLNVFTGKFRDNLNSPAFTLGETSPRVEIICSATSNRISESTSPDTHEIGPSFLSAEPTVIVKRRRSITAPGITSNRLHPPSSTFSQQNHGLSSPKIPADGSQVQLKMPILDSKLGNPPSLASLLNPTSSSLNLKLETGRQDLMSSILNVKLHSNASISVHTLLPILDTKLGPPPLLYNLLSPKSKKKIDDSACKKTPILDKTLGNPPPLPANFLSQTNSDKPASFANRLAGLSGLTFRAPLGPPSTAALVSAKKKLKPVFIEKLDPGALKDTIYGEIHEEEHPGVSFADLQDLFENAPPKKPEPSSQPAAPAKKLLSSLISDSKRLQNINIMVMKFRKLTMQQLREAIIKVDPEIINVDACAALLPFCPIADEIRACKAYKDSADKLDNASQFLMAIYDIPQMGPRLRFTIFKAEAQERLTTVMNEIRMIMVGCDVLRHNAHFKLFLKLSLDVANTLNEGTARGQAMGLRPASLMSFDTVRANQPGVTLLLYMLRKIYEQKPEILDFTDDFAAVGEAMKVNIEGITTIDPLRNLQELKTEVDQLNTQLRASQDMNPPDTDFVSVFQGIYDTIAPLVMQAEEKASETKKYYIQTAKFLGEDDDTLRKKSSVEFFRVFKHLTETIKKFKVEEEERRKREMRKLAMVRKNSMKKKDKPLPN